MNKGKLHDRKRKKETKYRYTYVYTEGELRYNVSNDYFYILKIPILTNN